MRIWFTADTHFNHENVIKYSCRPFADLQEMTERLIENWNCVIHPGDTVYHLGDFALSYGKKHADLIDDLLRRLHGQKWLITGNHDQDEVTKNPRWVAVRDYHKIKVDAGQGIPKQPIVLSHYAFRVWDQCHYGSWMLHGHSHGNLIDVGGKIMDVGVDCNDYRPISLGEVAEFMYPREIISVDHHRSGE